MPSQSRRREATLAPDENSPPLNAQTSPADLYKLARQFQVERNAARSEATSLRRKFANVTNASEDEQDEEPTHMPKRARADSPASVDDLDEGENDVSNATDERFVYHAGHKFGLTCALWVHEGEGIFDVGIDEDYEAPERFETDENKVQGQLLDILGLLQVRLSEDTIRQRWVRRRFIESVHEQRFNTATRLRKHCAPILGVSATDLLKSEDRKVFRDQIGWVVDENGRGLYSTVDVEILHKDYKGEYSPSSAFLNPVLMSLYVALIRGPVAGMHLKKYGIIYHPQTQTMAAIHNIRHTTPGAIATTAVLARWVLSMDDKLQEVGSSTGIRYFKDCEEYLMILESGLRRKKKSVLNIFKKWDEVIFPDTNSSLAGPAPPQADDTGVKRVMDLYDAESDGDNGQSDGAQE